MAQLQWRDVAAPNLGVSLEGIKTFADMLGGAFNKADAGLTRFDNTLSAEANQGLALDIAAAQDADAAKQLVSTLRDRPNSQRFNTAMIAAAAARPGELTTQAAGELALSKGQYDHNRVVDTNTRTDAARTDVNRYLDLYANGKAGEAEAFRSSSESIKNLDAATMLGLIQGGQNIEKGQVDIAGGYLDNTGKGISNATNTFQLQTARQAEQDRVAVAGMMANIGLGAMDADSARSWLDANKSRFTPTQLGMAMGNINALFPGTFGTAELGSPAAGGAGGDGTWTTSSGMASAESGGRWGIVNGEGYGGRNQFGAARLADAAAAGIIPRGMTGAQFARLPPEKQMEVENWHWADIDRQAESRGLNRYLGQTVGGVRVTPGAIRGMAQIGGVGGALQFLRTGGRHNPSDSNGKSIRDYGIQFSNAPTNNPSLPRQAATELAFGAAQSGANGVNPQRLVAALSDTSTPDEVATKLADAFPGVPKTWLVGQINRLGRENNIPPGVAGEMLRRNVGEQSDRLGEIWSRDRGFQNPLPGLGRALTGQRTPNLAGGRRLDDAGLIRDIEDWKSGRILGRVDVQAQAAEGQAALASAQQAALTAQAQYAAAARRPGMAAQLPIYQARMEAANARVQALARSVAGGPRRMAVDTPPPRPQPRAAAPAIRRPQEEPFVYRGIGTMSGR